MARRGELESYLVTHYGLFDGSEVLERRQQNMSPLGTTDIFDKATELFTQGNQDFVLIFHGLCKVSRLELNINTQREVGFEAGKVEMAKRGEATDHRGRG